MQEIFNKLEFRAFSYEEDPEAVVDMHCCSEVLEGSWFDRSETCRMHAKIVFRSPGSSWVLAYNSLIFAHADLVKQPSGEASIIGWRIHENYRHPKVARLLLEGLSREAKKRECSGMIIFAESSKISEELAMLGMRPDRNYRYADISAAEHGKILRNERVVLHPDEIAGLNLHPFLGSPLPPAYLMQRAYLGADYAVFRHSKPATFEIYKKDLTFLACHDGREWFIFKKGDCKPEKDVVSSVLKTAASLLPGRILLSDRACEAADLIPINDGVYHDFFSAL
ncbi:MAG: GNAT family N-acetyltransferase [Candidatus Riflebacteria bacterium]|jgi:hypothetical protein|nr:GNAT family N-acetyltransferase [Candidatus Riflebacteria bacterium]